MGATSEMENPNNNEKPVHQVTLTNDYYMCKYEVTQVYGYVFPHANYGITPRPVDTVSNHQTVW